MVKLGQLLLTEAITSGDKSGDTLSDLHVEVSLGDHVDRELVPEFVEEESGELLALLLAFDVLCLVLGHNGVLLGVHFLF